MIYLEPAPYIVGFVDHVRSAWRGTVDVVYVSSSLTQPWGYETRGEGDAILPQDFFRAAAEIRRRLASGRYGLVHLAGWGHPILAVALLWARLMRLPVAVESDTPTPIGLPAWKRAIKRVVYPWFFLLPKMFLPGGSRQAVYLRDYGVAETRIRIAQMTVDVERIQLQQKLRNGDIESAIRKRCRIPNDAVCFLYLGRLEAHKGVGDLVQAWRLLSPNQKIFLLIAGDGSLRGDVEAAEAAIASVRYLGRLAGDEVWDAYAAADVLVLASHSEPWGLVVNEAMAMRLPVIVTDRVGCVDDLVQDGLTGLIVPAGSPEGLASAMKKLALCPELRAKMGVKAQDLISGWTLRTQAVRTITAWQRVLT